MHLAELAQIITGKTWKILDRSKHYNTKINVYVVTMETSDRLRDITRETSKLNLSPHMLKGHVLPSN